MSYQQQKPDPFVDIRMSCFLIRFAYTGDSMQLQDPEHL